MSDAITARAVAQERTRWQWAIVAAPEWATPIEEIDGSSQVKIVEMDQVEVLAQTEWYSLTEDEAREVIESYWLAIAEIEAAAHQVEEGIMLSRPLTSRDIARAVVELVELTPVGVDYCLAIRRAQLDD